MNEMKSHHFVISHNPGSNGKRHHGMLQTQRRTSSSECCAAGISAGHPHASAPTPSCPASEGAKHLRSAASTSPSACSLSATRLTSLALALQYEGKCGALYTRSASRLVILQRCAGTPDTRLCPSDSSPTPYNTSTDAVPGTDTRYPVSLRHLCVRMCMGEPITCYFR